MLTSFYAHVLYSEVDELNVQRSVELQSQQQAVDNLHRRLLACLDAAPQVHVVFCCSLRAMATLTRAYPALSDIILLISVDFSVFFGFKSSPQILLGSELAPAGSDRNAFNIPDELDDLNMCIPLWCEKTRTAGL